jgi:hypothetical protein
MKPGCGVLEHVGQRISSFCVGMAKLLGSKDGRVVVKGDSPPYSRVPVIAASAGSSQKK